VKIEEIPVGKLIEDCLDLREGILDNNGISLEMNLEDPRATLRGDRRLLRAAIGSLIEGAARRARPGGKITIAHGRDDVREIIAVCDDGRGMPYEELRSALDLFSRSRWRAEGELGEISPELERLSMVRDVVDLHGGRVGVRNLEGEGSSFTLHLPRRCA
jgi:signal transduction histidine kinase